MALGGSERLGGAHVDIDANADPYYRELNKLDQHAARAAKKAKLRIDQQLKNLKYEASIDVATKAAEATAKRLKEKYERQKWNVEIDVDKLKDFYLPKVKAVIDDIDVDANVEDIGVKAHLENKHHVKEELDDLADDRKVELDPEVNSPSKYATQAVLSYVGRARTAEFYPKINSRALAQVSTTLAALSGMRMLQNQSQSLIDMVKNLDKSIPKLTLISTAFGLIGNGLISLTSNAAALLMNVGQIAGAALALPSLFMGAAIGVGTMVVGLKDINNRLPGIKTMMEDLKTSINDNFWSGALDGVAKFFDTFFADFSAGIANTSKFTGEFTGKLASSFADAFDINSINTMFGNLNDSIRISSGNVGSLANIFRVLGETGSQYLPRLAQWTSDLTTKFSEWLTKIDQTGHLNDLIDTGIDRIKGLGSILLHSGQIIGRVGKIAEESGAASINSMADALERAAKITASEPFKSNLTRVFTSAHEAIDQITSKSGPAFTDLMKTLSYLIPDVLAKLGPSVGDALKGIFEGLDSNGFQSGFRKMFDGISKGITGFSQHIPEILSNLGSLGRVIGTLSQNFLPLLGQWLSSLTGLFATLAPVIEPLVPALTSIAELIAKAFNPAVLATVLALGPGLRIVSGALLAMSASSIPGLAKIGTGFEGLVSKSGKFGTAIKGASAVATSALGLLMLPLGSIGKAITSLSKTKVAGSLGAGFQKLATSATGASAATKAAAASAAGAAATTGAAGGVVAKTGGILASAGSAITGALGATGVAALGAVAGVAALAGGAIYLANNMHKTTIDTSLAAEQLKDFKSSTENIRGTELDNLLSTGWGPWTDEVNTAKEAYQHFGETASNTAKALEKGITSNHDIKSYYNDIKQMDETIANMVRSGNIDGARALYNGFRDEIRNAGGDVAMFEQNMRETTGAFRDQGYEIKTTTGFYDGLIQSIKTVTDTQKNQALATRASEEKFADYTSKFKTYNQEIFNANDAIRNSLNQYEDFNVTDTTGQIIEMSQAFSAAELTAAGLTTNYDDFKQALVTGTRPMRDYGSALEGVIQNDLAAIESAKARGMSMNDLAALSGDLYTKFLDLAGGDEQLKAQLATFASEAGLLPYEQALDGLNGAFETTILKANGTEMAITKLSNGKYVVTIDGQQITATSQQVEDLGWKVEKGADGTFTINGKEKMPASWGGDLQSYLEFIELPAEKQVEIIAQARTDQADAKLKTLQQENSNKTIEMPVDVSKEEADLKLKQIQQENSNKTIEMPVDVDTATPTVKFHEMFADITGRKALINLDADPTGANGTLTGFAAGASKYVATMRSDADTLGADLAIHDFVAMAGSGKYSVGIGLKTQVLADTYFGADGVVSNIANNFRGWIGTATSYGDNWAGAASAIQTDANNRKGFVVTSGREAPDWMKAAQRVKIFTDGQTGAVGASSTLRSSWSAAANAVMSFTNTRTGFVGASSTYRAGWQSAPFGIVNTVNGMSASIRVGTVQASGALSAAYSLAASVSSIVARIRTTSNNGNIFAGIQHFANGGFSNREKHVAMIAQAGTRVWAEPETGGEAYIPLALSKRARSREILQRTSELLDMTRPVPKGTAYGDGGINSNRRPYSGGQGEVKVYMSVANGDKMNEEQFGRAVSRELASKLR